MLPPESETPNPVTGTCDPKQAPTLPALEKDRGSTVPHGSPAAVSTMQNQATHSSHQLCSTPNKTPGFLMKKVQPVTRMNQQTTSFIERIHTIFISFIDNIHMTAG